MSNPVITERVVKKILRNLRGLFDSNAEYLGILTEVIAEYRHDDRDEMTRIGDQKAALENLIDNVPDIVDQIGNALGVNI